MHVNVCDLEIQSDTSRYALNNTVRYSQIHTDMHCFQNADVHVFMTKIHTHHQQTALCVFSAYHAYIFIYAENTLIGCMRE
jgi:hypothetical protein